MGSKLKYFKSAVLKNGTLLGIPLIKYFNISMQITHKFDL